MRGITRVESSNLPSRCKRYCSFLRSVRSYLLAALIISFAQDYRQSFKSSRGLAKKRALWKPDTRIPGKKVSTRDVEADSVHLDERMMREMPKLLPTTQLDVQNASTYVNGRLIAQNFLNAFKDTAQQAREFVQWMIFPTPLNQFLENHIDKSPLLIQRGHPTYYNGWFDEQTMRSIISSKKLVYRRDIDVLTYNHGTKFVHRYNGISDGSVMGDGNDKFNVNDNDNATSTPHDVWRFFHQGRYIRLNRPHEYDDNVWALVSQMDAYWGTTCGCNAYLTPPGSQGIAPHWNDVDTFVLMTQGSHRWRVYTPQPDQQLPLDPGEDLSNLNESECIIDKNLSPGDFLFIPRGFIYQESNSGSCVSSFLVLSVNQHSTYADFLAVMLQKGFRAWVSIPYTSPALLDPIHPSPFALGAVDMAAMEDVQFRRTIPVGFTRYMGFQFEKAETQQRVNFTKTCLDLLERMVAKGFIPLDQAADQFAFDHLSWRVRPRVWAPSTDNHSKNNTSNRKEIEAFRWIKLVCADGARLHLHENQIRVVHCMGNSRSGLGDESTTLLLDLKYGPALDVIINVYPKSVKVSDLPDLNPDEQVWLASLLYGEGIVMDTTKDPD